MKSSSQSILQSHRKPQSRLTQYIRIYKRGFLTRFLISKMVFSQNYASSIILPTRLNIRINRMSLSNDAAYLCTRLEQNNNFQGFNNY